MNIIYGNILDIKEGYICHQVNCQKVAGAGLALQIRNKWPDWYAHYLSVTQELGKADIYKIDTNLYVVSLYAQNYYGRDRNYTDYDALKKSLNEISHLNNLYIPYGIGAGLAGGDWDIISCIIEKTIPHAIIVKYRK